MASLFDRLTYSQIAKSIDHSLLRPELDDAFITDGCHLAVRYDVASATLRPSDVARARKLLDGASVKVGTVIGFPHGSSTTATKVFEAQRALAEGAVELDMVIDIAALRSGRDDHVREQIAAIVRVEGPIHEQLLIERLKEIYAVVRAGPKVQANVDRAITVALQAHRLERSEGRFLRPQGFLCGLFRTPGDGVHRPLALVPPDELDLAILYVVEDQFGVPRDALPHALVELFGFERARAGAVEVIGNRVDDLVERGRLRVSGPNVYVG